MFRKFIALFREFVPMSVICWREGYRRELFFDDLRAGISVGLIALPLAMAFAIGSGVDPERGLYTAIFAGFLISLLGGSRVQIGGPTGAFIIIVLDVVIRHGYDGLAIATLLAGVMMILMGLARFGVFLKFIPYPVTVGFTTGIALVIFSSQMKDFFGLCINPVPAKFLDKWTAYAENVMSCTPWASLIAVTTLFLIFFFRRYKPKWPNVIIAIALATIISIIFDLPMDTIQSKFGSIPNSLPMPSFPAFTLEKVRSVFPDAIAIALLGAIESLLSAVVGDGMTGHRHRSNCELVAQGLANIGSVLVGGIPATGAIARTSANIKLGGKTPMAGMVHAVTLLLIMVICAPLVSKVPLASLAAVLIYVAWNMSELPHFYSLLRGPWSDALVLMTTFLLTVLVDLTVAVQVGVVLSAMLFVKRMSDTTNIKICKALVEENAYEYPDAHDSDIIFRKDVPEDTVVFEINGPFFFAVSDLLNEQWQNMTTIPKIFILRMRKVSIIDATGVRALNDFILKCHQHQTVLLLSGVHGRLEELLADTGIEAAAGKDHVFPDLGTALKFAKTLP